jgi:hypothetical protein
MVKGETVMPVPEGNITTSEILIPKSAEELDAVIDAAIAAADEEEELIPFERINTDDLPELS